MQLIWSTPPIQTYTHHLRPKESKSRSSHVHKIIHVIRRLLLSVTTLIRTIIMAADRDRDGENNHYCHNGGSGGGGGGMGNAGENYRTQKTAQRAVPLLNWLIPLGAIASVINVTISMCTGEWLKSYERIPVDTPGSLNKDEFRVKRTVSGLWGLCYANSTEETELHCFTIDYFAKDRYTPEPHDSTMAIPYTVTKAGPLFIVASIFLGIAILFASLGHIWRSKRIATFIAGIIFIISGLIMLIGIVVYLSVLQSEIGTKLRARNALDAALFSYSYGYGFVLIVIGFMFTELTGTCAIFWYIYWHQLDWAQKEGFGNGDIGVGASRPLSKGFESSDCAPHYSSSSGPNNIGWNHNHHPHHNSSSNANHRHAHGHGHAHANHHHSGSGHGRAGERETDSRGFSRGDELNSYYTYSAVGDGGTYCKKHGHPNYQCQQQHLPCYCGNSNVNANVHASSKKYRHHKQHGGSRNQLSGPLPHTHGHNCSSSSSNQFYHHYGDYDEDVDNILEVPFPPPPPNRPIPRDLTCTTTVSGGGDDYYGNPAPAHDHGTRDSRDLRKTTPV